VPVPRDVLMRAIADALVLTPEQPASIERQGSLALDSQPIVW
jgi:hypothetical protein